MLLQSCICIPSITSVPCACLVASVPPRTMSAIHPLTEKGDLELIVLQGGLGAETSLRLRCHQTILRLASPLLDDLLECSAPEASAPSSGNDNDSAATGEARRLQPQLPTLCVDGSAAAWTAVLAHLYSGFSPPLPPLLALPLSLGSSNKWDWKPRERHREGSSPGPVPGRCSLSSIRYSGH